MQPPPLWGGRTGTKQFKRAGRGFGADRVRAAADRPLRAPVGVCLHRRRGEHRREADPVGSRRVLDQGRIASGPAVFGETVGAKSTPLSFTEVREEVTQEMISEGSLPGVSPGSSFRELAPRDRQEVEADPRIKQPRERRLPEGGLLLNATFQELREARESADTDLAEAFTNGHRGGLLNRRPEQPVNCGRKSWVGSVVGAISAG